MCARLFYNLNQTPLQNFLFLFIYFFLHKIKITKKIKKIEIPYCRKLFNYNYTDQFLFQCIVEIHYV